MGNASVFKVYYTIYPHVPCITSTIDQQRHELHKSLQKQRTPPSSSKPQLCSHCQQCLSPPIHASLSQHNQSHIETQKEQRFKARQTRGASSSWHVTDLNMRGGSQEEFVSSTGHSGPVASLLHLLRLHKRE